MRELKFRAWDDDRKRYDYNSHLMIHLDGKVSNLQNGESDIYTIEQFTGLHDKNGKEIHEGDICNVDDGENLYEIIFYRGGFMVAVLPRKIRIYHIGDSLFNNIEIIGNIHENPELVK